MMTETSGKPATTGKQLLWRLGWWALGIGIALWLAGWVGGWRTPVVLGWVGCFLGVIYLIAGRFSPNQAEPLSAAHRRYFRHFIPAIVAYVLALVLVTSLDNHGLVPWAWARALLSLLPVVPIVWLVWALWRLVQDVDELERRIQMESIYLTCGITGILSFAGGMLEMAGVFQLKGGLMYVLPLMFLVYGVTHWWSRRKYGFKGGC